jgi:hypothetical protein
MPLSAEFGNHGTDERGAPVNEYCMFCYKGGAFTNPGQTLDEMIASSIENMTGDLGMPVEQATQLANSVIPPLKRWQQPLE